MSAPSATTEPPSGWFCVRSQPKREHIAASHLRELPDVDVVLPRIRFRRATRRGAVWVTEALFPNYLFARFDWHASLRRVHHCTGVASVVHFGDRWPTVPDAVIERLRAGLGADEVRELPNTLAPGDAVQVTGGVFHGLEAVVRQVLPARQRVIALLEFLGRQTAVEVDAHHLVRLADERATLL